MLAIQAQYLLGQLRWAAISKFRDVEQAVEALIIGQLNVLLRCSFKRLYALLVGGCPRNCTLRAAVS